MEDPSQFANMYIEKVLNELIELTKIRLMNETRIAYLEKVNAELLVQIQNYNQAQEPPQPRKKVKNSQHQEAEVFGDLAL